MTKNQDNIDKFNELKQDIERYLVFFTICAKARRADKSELNVNLSELQIIIRKMLRLLTNINISMGNADLSVYQQQLKEKLSEHRKKVLLMLKGKFEGNFIEENETNIKILLGTTLEFLEKELGVEPVKVERKRIKGPKEAPLGFLEGLKLKLRDAFG